MPSLKVAIRATAVYFAVVALGLAYLFQIANAAYGKTPMIVQSWMIQIILCAVCLYYVWRYFGWSGAGFAQCNWRGLVWLLPAYLVLVLLFIEAVPAMLSGSLSSADRNVLAALAFTTFLIGFSEEVMFRGILLRGALTRLSVAPAMLLSAVAFSFVHALNGLGSQPGSDMLQHLAFTFLVGFFLAPVALRIGNLWPLIIWHWLWDMAVFSSGILGVIQPFALAGILTQVIISLVLWSRIVKEG